MTEHEKLLAGLHYNTRDPELLGMYHNARAVTKQLAQLDSHDFETKLTLLREMLGGFGDESWIELPFWCDNW